MMTQTHLLMAAAVFAKPGDWKKTAIAVAGGLVPDFMLTALFFNARFQGVSTGTIFNDLFWSEKWSNLMAPGNSFVLFAIFLIVGIVLQKSSGTKTRIGTLIVVFCVSAYLHLITDFFLHAEDARVQFWPLSDWIFHPPVSYWDGRYYGNWFQPFEIALGFLCLAILFNRYRSRIVRIILISVMILYLAMPLFFYFSYHGV